MPRKIMTEPIRKPDYQRPRLKVYGQMQVITQTNVTMGMTDMGNGSQAMT
jgi:hypothetical protein